MKNEHISAINKVLTIVLFLGICFTFVQVVSATAPNPGHNFNEVGGGVAQGDLLFGTSADLLAALPKDTNATRYLSNTGTNNNPAWNQINLTNGVTGVLPSANGGSPVSVHVLASLQNSVSATPAKVTGLDTTVGAGTYVFQYYIRWQSSSTATGSKFDVNHSGTVTSFVWNERRVDASATASTAAPDQNNIQSAAAVMSAFGSRAKGTAGRGFTLSVDTASADMFTIIEGLMVVTVSGDLQLYFGSETTTGTLTIEPGSSLVLTQVS